MHGKRLALGVMLSATIAAAGALAVRAQSREPLRFAISFPAARSSQARHGSARPACLVPITAWTVSAASRSQEYR